MPLVFVKEERGREGSQDDKFVGRATRHYLVRWSVHNATSQDILSIATPTLPRQWDPLPDADWILVKNKKAVQRADNPFLWDVEVEYSSEIKDPEAAFEDPLARPAEISIDGREHREAAFVDEDDLAILNSAGLPFDPPPELLYYHELLTITRNEVAERRAFWRGFRGAVNLDAWYGGPPYSSKCIRIAAVLMFENGVRFWRVTYQFEIIDLPMPPGENTSVVNHPGGRTWFLRPLDAGYEEWDAANDRYKAITVFPGVAATKPHPLDGTGMKLTFGDDPVFLQFRTFRTKNFAELGIFV